MAQKLKTRLKEGQASLRKIADHFGGIVKFSEKCGINHQTIYQFINRGKPFRPGTALYISNFCKKEGFKISPDLLSPQEDGFFVLK